MTDWKKQTLQHWDLINRLAQRRFGDSSLAEEAALFVCRALLQTGNKNAFTTLRQEWQGMETNTGAWFALDVDASLVAGKRERALNTLTSTQFEGKTEAIRLTRLALLTATDDLEKAWGYLVRL